MEKLNKEELSQLDQFYKQKGMEGFKSYTVNNDLRKLDGTSFAEIKYDFFSIQEVLMGGIEIGEYHIKLTDGSNIKNAISFFRKHLPSVEIGLTDPEQIIQLEYPIYIIVKDKILQSGMMNIFSDLNEILKQSKGE